MNCVTPTPTATVKKLTLHQARMTDAWQDTSIASKTHPEQIENENRLCKMDHAMTVCFENEREALPNMQTSP